MIGVFELVKIYDLPTIPWSGDGEDFRFRIEVFTDLKEQASYYVKIYRHEHFRTQPTFPQKEDGTPALDQYDKALWVLDDFLISWQDSMSESIEACLGKVRAKIYDRFGVDFTVL
jgi:hypothetical protein